MVRACSTAAAFSISLFALASCAQPSPKNELFIELSNIMEWRKELWNKTADEGGERRLDITKIVCPIVSKESLGQMFADPELGWELRHSHFSVPSIGEDGRWKNDYEWFVKKPLNLIQSQWIWINIDPDANCTARYRHTH